MHGTIWDEEHRQWVTESVWLPEAAAYYATVAPHGRQSSIVKLSIRNTVMEKYSR